MFALPISKPRFKSIKFYQNIPKIKLFLQKNAYFFGWLGLRPKTVPPEAGDLPPDPHPPAAGGFAQAPKTSSHCEFLITRLVVLLLLCYFV